MGSAAGCAAGSIALSGLLVFCVLRFCRGRGRPLPHPGGSAHTPAPVMVGKPLLNNVLRFDQAQLENAPDFPGRPGALPTLTAIPTSPAPRHSTQARISGTYSCLFLIKSLRCTTSHGTPLTRRRAAGLSRRHGRRRNYTAGTALTALRRRMCVVRLSGTCSCLFPIKFLRCTTGSPVLQQPTHAPPRMQGGAAGQGAGGAHTAALAKRITAKTSLL